MNTVATRLAELRLIKQRALDHAALAMAAGDWYTRTERMEAARAATAEQRRILAEVAS